jgi:hypothetical protein
MKLYYSVRVWLLLILLWFGSSFEANAQQCTKAQLSHSPNRHIVILIDAAPAPYYQYLLQDSSELPNKISQFLKEKNLYNKGDYLSIVSYALGVGNMQGQNLKKFITIPKYHGETLSWQQFNTKVPILDLKNNWSSISYSQHISKLEDPIGSVNSLRLYYALRAVSSKAENLAANSLYVITISDDIHQGNDDIAGELRKLLQISPLDAKVQKSIQDESTRFSNGIKKNFSFLTDPSKRIIDNKSSLYPFQLVVTEVKPSREPSIQSLLHLPIIPDLKRIRGGYRLDIQVPQVDPSYKLEKMELTITTPKADDQLFETSEDHLSIILPTNNILTDSVSATLRAWVRFKDGVYNGMVLNPYDTDYPGLNMTQQLVTRDEPKILGLMRVSDAWWFSFLPDTYEDVVIVYSTVIWLIVVAAIAAMAMYIIKKMSTYIPATQSIKIYPVESFQSKAKNASKTKKNKIQ